MNRRGRVAQLGERVVRNDEVAGSIPVTSTKFLKTLKNSTPPRDFAAITLEAPLVYSQSMFLLSTNLTYNPRS
jgi:hypothetical protein